LILELLTAQESLAAAQSGQSNDGEITQLRAELKQLQSKDSDIEGVKSKAKQEAEEYDTLARQRKAQKA
jgi:hypothetical protein